MNPAPGPPLRPGAKLRREAALRRRLNGGAIAIPPVAGEKLGEVLKKALAFDRAERYENTAELAEGLRGCVGEGDAAAMAAQHTSYACVEKNIRAMVGRLHRAGGAPYARLMGGLPSERPSNDAFLRRLAGRLPEM